MTTSASSVTLVQLVATGARLATFAFVVLTLDRSGGFGHLLVVIGFVPFVAFVDIGVQAYSRAQYLEHGSPPRWAAGYRRGFALAALSLVGAALVVEEAGATAALPALLVATYVAGGIAQLWERGLAVGRRPLAAAVVEVVALAAAAAYLGVSGPEPAAVLAGLASMPLARLLTHAAVTDEESPPELQDAPALGSRRYVGYSLAQQLAGAFSAALPAIYAQVSGDHSTLARNLVVFRLAHSGAAAASTAVNAIASRIFYGTAGSGFLRAERAYVEHGAAVGAAGAALALAAAAASLAAAVPVSVSLACVVLLLVLVNLQSSLLMNRGLPARALNCQLLALGLSGCMLARLEGTPASFGVAVLVLGALHPFVNRSNLQAYRRCLTRSPP